MFYLNIDDLLIKLLLFHDHLHWLQCSVKFRTATNVFLTQSKKKIEIEFDTASFRRKRIESSGGGEALCDDPGLKFQREISQENQNSADNGMSKLASQPGLKFHLDYIGFFQTFEPVCPD